MKKLNATVLVITMTISLALVCVATNENCPISLPVAVFGSLGIHAVWLLIAHRQKLSGLLGRRQGS